MQVKVSEVNVTNKSCTVTLSDGTTHKCSLFLPPYKGSENKASVNIADLHNYLEPDVEHNKWISIPRDLHEGTYDTVKKEVLPKFITINNLANYVTPEEYNTVLPIWTKAMNALNVQLAERALAEAKKKV